MRCSMRPMRHEADSEDGLVVERGVVAGRCEDALGPPWLDLGGTTHHGPGGPHSRDRRWRAVSRLLLGDLAGPRPTISSPGLIVTGCAAVVRERLRCPQHLGRPSVAARASWWIGPASGSPVCRVRSARALSILTRSVSTCRHAPPQSRLSVACLPPGREVPPRGECCGTPRRAARLPQGVCCEPGGDPRCSTVAACVRVRRGCERRAGPGRDAGQDAGPRARRPAPVTK